jgi:glycosyltransferase involved in cell wall biosynthesis
VKDKQKPQRPIRIARIIDRLNVGGPAKHVVWLTAGLPRDKFESLLIAGHVAPAEGDMTYFAAGAGVLPDVVPELSRALSLRDVVVVGKLVYKFWRFRPDIVHTHKAKAGATGRVAVILYRWLTLSALWFRPRPCWTVHTYHGHVFHGYFDRIQTWVFVSIERILARFGTDRIVVLSKQQQREICDEFHVGYSGQYRIIPLGIDFAEFSSFDRPLHGALGSGGDELVIGSIGRLSEVKNHSLLLKSIARLRSDGMRVRCVIVGDGELRSRLEGEARDLGIANCTDFLGFRRDVLALYQSFDIVAWTSLNEGTPLTMIEAMACGRAIVATEVGGIVDLLGKVQSTKNGMTVWDYGLTVRGHEPAPFCSALRLLIDDRDLRCRMGERAAEFVHSRFSRERLLHDISELYIEIANAKPET